MTLFFPKNPRFFTVGHFMASSSCLRFLSSSPCLHSYPSPSSSFSTLPLSHRVNYTLKRVSRGPLIPNVASPMAFMPYGNAAEPSQGSKGYGSEQIQFWSHNFHLFRYTSTSSHCFPSGSKISSPLTEDLSGSLKRARSEAELWIIAKKEQNKILERTQSNKTLGDHPPFETVPSLPIAKSWPSKEVSLFKAKATFGEEKVRFTVLPNMSFLTFQREIARRFNLMDLSKISIKYLDDNGEWVLLTCDADLVECIDLHRSSGNHTIKLAPSQITSSGGSIGSRGFP